MIIKLQATSTTSRKQGLAAMSEHARDQTVGTCSGLHLCSTASPRSGAGDWLVKFGFSNTRHVTSHTSMDQPQRGQQLLLRGQQQCN
jgi:hypothetical protein